MQSSDIPALIPTPFAKSGLKNTIPENGPPPNPNNATFDAGFPAITMQPISSGGLPPYGQDMNGILNAITLQNRWANAGGTYAFNSTFANDANVNGYPKGALLAKANRGGFWFNTIDNNTSNPDTGGAGWVDLASILSSTPVVVSDALLRLQLKTGSGYCNVTGKLASGDGGSGFFYYDSADVTSGAYFTGSISGSTLTISAIASGVLTRGQAIARSDTGATVAYITDFGTGTGGTGTYTLSASATIGSMTMMADNASTLFVAADGGRWKIAINSINNALTGARVAPHPNFSWFTSDFTVSACPGPGRAVVYQDLADVFQTKFGASIGGTISYVHPNGSDSNGGTSWRDAFATLGKALRNTTNGTIYIWTGTYAPSDFRYTDSYGDHPKKIIGYGGPVILRYPGDAASAATWILDGDYGGMYNMCIASANQPIRLLRKDLIDKYGNPLPMPYYGTRAGLSTQNFGWAYENNKSVTATVTTTSGNAVVTTSNAHQITVGMAFTGAGIQANSTVIAVVPGASITLDKTATASATITATATGNILSVRDAMSANVNTTTKNSLDIVYGNSSADAITLLYSTTSYWEGITFYGYLSILNASGQATPQFWGKNCKFYYGNTHELLVQGGYSYTQDCVGGYGAADGANYNITNSIISQGVEINYKTYYQGDILTYGLAQTLNPQGTGTNKNGSSNHDSYVVRINGNHFDPYGPNIADTSTSYSWYIGVQVGYNAIAPNSIPATPRYGFLNQSNNAWMDGCAATGQDAGFNSDTNAGSRMFNNFGTTSATNSGVFINYYPSPP